MEGVCAAEEWHGPKNEPWEQEVQTVPASGGDVTKR